MLDITIHLASQNHNDIALTMDGYYPKMENSKCQRECGAIGKLEKKNDAATVENNMIVPQEIKYRINE